MSLQVGESIVTEENCFADTDIPAMPPIYVYEMFSPYFLKGGQAVQALKERVVLFLAESDIFS